MGQGPIPANILRSEPRTKSYHFSSKGLRARRVSQQFSGWGVWLVWGGIGERLCVPWRGSCGVTRAAGNAGRGGGGCTAPPVARSRARGGAPPPLAGWLARCVMTARTAHPSRIPSPFDRAASQKTLFIAARVPIPRDVNHAVLDCVLGVPRYIRQSIGFLPFRSRRICQVNGSQAETDPRYG